ERSTWRAGRAAHGSRGRRHRVVGADAADGPADAPSSRRPRPVRARGARRARGHDNDPVRTRTSPHPRRERGVGFGWLFHFVLAVFSAWNLIEAMRRPRWRLWGLVVALWLVI